MNPKLKLLPFTIIIAVSLEIIAQSGLSIIEIQSPNQQVVYIKAFKEQKNSKVILDAPITPQKPELYNGCEICSLTMLLKYAGIRVDKMTLTKKIKKDKTELVLDKKRNIVKWGNPNDGFVGDITGRRMGYGVHLRPVIELLEKYLPGKSVNLTGQPFDRILRSIDRKRPVIIWATIDFTPPKNFKLWKKNNKTVKVTFKEHAVLLVGYDEDYCYINNPYNGMKNQKIRKEKSIISWRSMGSMAISYR